ncbi:MAG: LysM domain-containing protein [Lachnospiraceae bacterium]|nr:LysM domain-containing protein [Butyrivibrio sp.]MCM1342763.1 LysM domain-containing protein [Muribaculaceae bacterium]MCM1409973.1 LysM domain-containing protein [Lachnospiraceae bacterium]
MKRRILALLLGGALAVGGPLMMPATAQAATLCTDPTAHMTASSFTLTPGNGQVTIQWRSNIPNFCAGSFDNYMDFIAAEGAIENANTQTINDLSEEDYRMECADGQTGGSCIVDHLKNGTSYSVYVQLHIGRDANGDNVFGVTEDLHTLLYVGEVTPDASLSNAPVVSPSDSNPSNNASSASSSSGSVSAGSSAERETAAYEDEVTEEIEAAPSGSTIVMDEGISALSNSVMKELLAKGDVSLRMEFTYQDKEYVIVIPAGAALDNDIPWYGPLYLAQHFGNRAGTASAGEGGTYEVKSGDSLSRIARANNMTLQQLLAKNPQIKDPNKITVGQKINR